MFIVSYISKQKTTNPIWYTTYTWHQIIAQRWLWEVLHQDVLSRGLRHIFSVAIRVECLNSMQEINYQWVCPRVTLVQYQWKNLQASLVHSWSNKGFHIIDAVLVHQYIFNLGTYSCGILPNYQIVKFPRKILQGLTAIVPVKVLNFGFCPKLYIYQVCASIWGYRGIGAATVQFTTANFKRLITFCNKIFLYIHCFICHQTEKKHIKTLTWSIMHFEVDKKLVSQYLSNLLKMTVSFLAWKCFCTNPLVIDKSIYWRKEVTVCDGVYSFKGFSFKLIHSHQTTPCAQKYITLKLGIYQKSIYNNTEPSFPSRLKQRN